MENHIGDQFVKALEILEAQRDTEPMKSLFADNCTLWNVQMKHPLQGHPTANVVFAEQDRFDSCSVFR